jgi:crossover junction endodeoxyribonuclease RuvC
MAHDVKILAIDPGTRLMGFAVMSGDGRGATLERAGTFRPAGDAPPKRLASLCRKVEFLLRRHGPAAVVVERAFLAKNPRTFERLAEARAAVLIAAARGGRPVHQYAPSEVKQALTRWGRASKGQVQRTVQARFGLRRAPAPDAADAIALGVCHFWRMR